MEQIELNKILKKHQEWLESDREKGERANLSFADLHSADLSSADLRSADLHSADLRRADLSSADLSSADLHSADLSRADLSYADLHSADLSSADLSSADLSYADLRRADLSSANLDYSAFPLWCGGLKVNIDDKQAIQLLYHLVKNVLFSKNTSKEMKKLCSMESIIKKANEFHKVIECGRIEV